MKPKSLLMLMLITFFVLSCATVSPGPALLVSDSPTILIEVPDSEISPYFLAELYDPIFFTEYDPFFISETAVKETDDSKNILDYFAVLSIYDEIPFSITEPAPGQTLVSEIQYYLEDIYDYDADSKILPDSFAVLSIINETPFPITEPAPEQTLVSEIQYYLEEIYDYDEPFFITKTSGKN